jgi:hypothetical protein
MMPIITIMQTTEPSHPMPYQSIQHPVNIYELVFRGLLHELTAQPNRKSLPDTQSARHGKRLIK